MRKAAALIAAALTVAATPALLAQTSSTGGNRLVCKERQSTGTRFAKPNCRTAAEWEMMMENHKRVASELINRPAIETRK